MAIPFYISTIDIGELHFYTSFPALALFIFFIIAIPVGVMWHFITDLIGTILMTNAVLESFHMIIGNLYIIFGEIDLNPFSTY